MSSDNLVLVDGDIIVYRVGFSSDHSVWEVCKARVDKMMVDILTNTNSDLMFGYLTEGSQNFRNKVAVTLPYKGNRHLPKPKHYDAIRRYLQDEHGFEMHKTQEADDAIGIAHAEMTDWRPREGVIIATIDKDLLMIPGFHYNIADGLLSYIGVKEARKLFYSQVLTGDRTDNIAGIRGIGPVKARKILDSSIHYGNTVINEFVQHGLTKEQALETAELIWIRRQTLDEDNPGFHFGYADMIYNLYKE